MSANGLRSIYPCKQKLISARTFYPDKYLLRLSEKDAPPDPRVATPSSNLSSLSPEEIMSSTPNFQNIYYKRTTATAKPCFICYRPTTTVLATINTVDFLYTCDGHLKDAGFATKIDPPTQAVEQEKPKVSDEEIKKIKEEWEEKQRQKEKAGDKDKDKNSDKDKKDSSPKPKSTPPGPTPMPVIATTTPKPTHERYVLHRSIWAMRLAEHKKKRQTTAAKQVAPRLPIAPRSLPTLPPPPPSS